MDGFASDGFEAVNRASVTHYSPGLRAAAAARGAAAASVDLMQCMRQGMFEAMRSGMAIERMNTRLANKKAMLEAMKALKPATEKLYAVLTDEQKKVADQLIGIDCGAM